MEKYQFCRCSVQGSGKILSNNSKYIKFQIIDLSADGARISSLIELEANAQIKMIIVLPSFLFQVKITTDAKIVQKKEVDNGFEYDVDFIGLSEQDQLEIDEMIRSTSTTIK